MTPRKTGWRRTGESAVKPNITYNKHDNEVMVRTDENFIYVICKEEKQTDKVVEKLTTPQCKLVSYEEWDEGEDKRWILSFFVTPDEYEITPELN
tara:strand:- start:4281 stop:4565 length:285 start_codon:yes stop_codon:yes gene_type:complete